jgi:predicted metal-dependent HD superfamily phosphohydrolase
MTLRYEAITGSGSDSFERDVLRQLRIEVVHTISMSRCSSSVLNGHDGARRGGYPGGMFASRHAPLTIAPEVERALATAYGQAHRAYHNAAHITEVLRWFELVADEVGWNDAAAVYLAVVFHDAVYEPTRSDNEARSARLARELAHAPERTAELILLTARHGSIEPGSIDSDAAHFLDCDTAILGTSPAEFEDYDAAIAAEYRHLPTDVFRAGRRAFLAKLLTRPYIFLTELFRARCERAARANLEGALARYTDRGTGDNRSPA